MHRTFITRTLQAKNITQQSRIFHHTRSISTTTYKMQSQNSAGQGASHAIGDSKVPQKVQEAAPVGLEKGLPEKVHPTGDANESQRVSHAKGGGEASVVPQKLQEILPERVERDVPNALHDTGDESGLHRK